MRQKTQTDRTRPPLCHAAVREPDGGQVNARADRHNFSRPTGSKLVGAAFEARAMEFLQRQRLRFVARNVLCRGGEIDLVMRDRDGALVFVEVRARAQQQYGGAAASIGWQKKQRIVRAARYYLATRSRRSYDEPACRFDVIAFEAGRLVWLRDAFRADEV
ncbi:YraN family protein [Paraburkholderia aspalathi]|uniref:YraN family protein n=1 Tax=Paraburkholderia nemoris TaxID=2793076 RepID=UPI00190A3E3A|nr:YraN family protein [Paraburkholderia nemoris]MBK3740140.1 YraN family protein [Paraburkholderia aspalathi]